jgi:pyridoxamine 5'-phosphate oxidase
MSISAIRRDYILQSLSETDTASDPLMQFHAWWEEAIKAQIDEVNAMTLATADASGKPSARIVLLKGLDDSGFSFFTNYGSIKGKQLAENPRASLVFFWKELERQVRIEGLVEKLPALQSDQYFLSRPQASRIGAWSSPQSSVIPSRDVLDANMKAITEKFSEGEITRPEFWGGYIVKPNMIEFWQGRSSRLHDRIQYVKDNDTWIKRRLAP